MSSRRDPFDDFDIDRFHIFVPAVMSVGLLFSVFSLARDLLQWLGRASRRALCDRRGETVARWVLEPAASNGPGELIARRPRRAYLVTAVLLSVLGIYVIVGSVANYARSGSYVADIAWLLALALAAGGLALAIALLAWRVYLRWDTAPVWTWATLDRLPIGARTSSGAEGPSWKVSLALQASAVATALVALAVGSARGSIRGFDEWGLDAVRGAGWLDGLGWTDVLGNTPLSIVLAGLVGLGAIRCRALAASYLGALGGALIVSEVLRALIERPRPPGSRLTGAEDSFPSGHVIQMVLIAGLVPLAVAVMSGQRRIVTPLRLLLGALVVVAALGKLQASTHWPSDVIGGALIGLTLVAAVTWIMEHPRWHDHCRSCPWATAEVTHTATGLLRFAPRSLAAIRWTARIWAAGAAVALAVLTVTVGIPQNPVGFGYGSQIQQPTQIGLAVLLFVGGALAWRWEPVGAVLIALAAGGLAVFAAVEYPPAYALALVAALALPAVLFWLAWQHGATFASMLVLAASTTLLLGASWAGVRRVNAFYYGPATVQSDTAALPLDRVEWVWSGALGPRSATVVARLEDADDGPATRVGLELTAQPAGAAPGAVSDTVAVDRWGLARLDVTGLQPDTAYRYRVVVDGEVDRSRGQGELRTPGVGAYSFRFATASCARTDSNAAVYDTIRDLEPLFFLGLGDLHYGNIESTEQRSFLRAFDRMSAQPAQAALFRSTPLAYVWDDHDYGPNDADASSPSRAAARAAYRAAIPHAPLAFPELDGPISQAFTIGRVRFVLTDTRSERTDAAMLGDRQEAWLIDELVEASRTHALVVWANPDPWVGTATAGADSWAGYADDRTRIADALVGSGVHNLVMVSGDAHMVAIDDGTNTDYSTAGSSGFPLLQAAALDRPGNVKGGPYSGGAFPGAGQFGLVDIDDDGSRVVVTMTGRTWDGRELASHRFVAGPGAS